MEEKIEPNQSIIQALNSDLEDATPFSRIPGFIKKYTITKNNKEELISILSSIGNKELSYISARVNKIQNNENGFTPETYNKIIEIEGGKDNENKSINSKLIGLAKEIIASEMGSPVYQILKQVDANLGTGIIDPSKFNNPHQDNSTQFSDNDKIFIQQEQQARIIINSLIMGAGHRIFDKIESDKKYPKAINKISPNLYQDYYDMVYTNLKNMRENKASDSSGINTGSMQLVNENDQTRIKIKADIFPVLLHEMAKGVIEYLAYTRYNNMNAEIVESILSVDSRESEHWMMLVGPQIYKQLFFLIKEAIAQYDDEIGLVEGKKESDYILPIILQILQFPADKFLSFIESILREDKDGNESIGSIKKIINNINNQYQQHITSSNAQKTELTIQDIIKQLTRELEIGKEGQSFITNALPEVQTLLQSEGYTISNKKLARKLSEHFPEYFKKYGISDTINQSRLSEIHDTVEGFRKSKIEQTAFGQVHEQQKRFPKRTKTHEGKSINIHPRFPLSTLEEAKKNINSEALEEINNKLIDFIQKGSVSEWISDHHQMSTILANLTEKFITLDDTVPECLMERKDNRGLYELTNLEQLKRESGSMGGHCVPDFINSVNNGSLRIFSLRQGTKSHRTIGYRPKDQTIIQVKGYTNQKKNSTLTLEDPDYEQVRQALKYICNNTNVRQINDIDILYKEGFLLTNEGLVSSAEFEKVTQDGEIYETTPLKEYSKVTLSDIKTLEKINLKNIGIIEFIKRGLSIQYNTQTKTIEINKISEVKESSSNEIGIIIEKLSSIKIHDFFTEYDGYPVFRSKTRAFVQKDGKYGFIERTEGRFKEILACEYDEIPLHLGENKYAVKQNGKYGIIKEHNGVFKKTLGCEYDYPPKLMEKSSSNNQYLVKKNLKCGIIRENDDDTWIELLPCKYDEVPNFGTDGLSADEARTKRNGKYGILRKTGTKFEEVLLCEYDSKADNQLNGNETYGLIKNEYLVYQNKKKGVIKKNNDNTWSEILPCEYDIISGTDFFDGNEIKVSKDKKHGFVKRDNERFIVILPCEYEEITEFGKPRLSPDETIVKKNGKYGIIRKNKENICGEILPCEYDSRPEFGDNILKDNEVIWADEGQFCVTRKLPIFGAQGIHTQAKVKFNGKPYIWKRNDDNTRDETIYEKYEEIKFKENGLQVNEARVKKDKKWGIIRDNKDGTWMPIVQCKYNSVELGFSENTKIISIGDYGHTYGVIQRNDDGTWTEIVACKYQEIQLGIKGLGSREMMVKDKIRSGKGIIKIDIDGKIKEIVPCQYDGITFGVKGLSVREALVFKVVGKDGKNKYKYGIIKINEDDTFTEILDCNYDDIEQVGLDYVIVEQDERTSIIQKDTGTRFFSNAYDEILQFATGGLGKNEAVVRDDKKIVIIRKDKDGIDKKIISEYIMKDFGKYGLQDGEARAKKEGQGMGIVKRSKNGSIKELLPCIYDAIDSLGKDGLGEDEAMVALNGKFGIVKRTQSGFQEILPCEYYIINTFNEEGLSRSQKEKNGEYTLLRRTKDGNIIPTLKSNEIYEFHFGEGGLQSNESFLRIEDNYGYGIVIKKDNETYEILFDTDYSFEINKPSDGLLENEYRVIYNGDYHGMIKREKDGCFIEAIPFRYQSDYVTDNQDPIVFYPELLDGKRIFIAINNDYEKEILIENSKDIFEKIENINQFLEQNKELGIFYAKTLRFYYEDAEESYNMKEKDENDIENNGNQEEDDDLPF